MLPMRGPVAFATAALVAIPSAPALAQSEEKDVFDGDYAIVAVGLGAVPDYEGADEMRITPAAGAAGRVGGVSFRLRGPSLTMDLIDDPKGAKVGLRLGPAVRYRSNRNGKTEDDVVARLGKVKGVVDAGFTAGVSFRKLLTGQDSLSIGTSARWDVSGRGSGYTVSPGISYLLPVSRGQVVGAAISGEFMSGKYARYNFSITPAGSLASGLPAFRAKGGFKEASVGAFTAWDLNGDLLDGGFSVGVGALYSRLYGSAAKTPITAIRGSRNQWLFGAGIGYTF